MAAFTGKPLSEAEYIAIGRLHGSKNVAIEASEGEGRWTRDILVLTDYGHGQTALDAFKALREKHYALMGANPDSVAEKHAAVTTKDADYKKAFVWLSKSVCTLKQVAQRDEGIANRLYHAMPDRDAEDLPKRIIALKTLLVDAKALAPEDPVIDARIAEADPLLATLKNTPSNVVAAKRAKVADTAELDCLDGQLVVAIRNLNEAGTKAIRAGELKAPLSEYRFNHISRWRQASEDDTTATTPEPLDY